MTSVLITGAAGNLGSVLSRYIRDNEHDLNLILMQHQNKIPVDLAGQPNIEIRNGDLSKPETINNFLDGADTIIYGITILLIIIL